MDLNIERVVDNLKDNALPLTLGVGGVLILYLLLSGKQKEPELVPATGYTSYPDAVTNANVIIGSVNDHTTTEIEQLRNEQIDGVNAVLDSLLSQNDFYNESLGNVLDKMDTSTEEVLGALETEKDLLNKVQGSIGNVQNSIDNVQSGIGNVQNSIDNVQSGIGNVQSGIGKVQSSFGSVQTTIDNIKTELGNKGNSSTTKPIQAQQGVGTVNKAIQSNVGVGTVKTSNTYTYKTKSGLNTSTSIVDALKATGEDSSMATRKKIAAANGISNYTGTAAQNTALLNKLKSGTLKKV